jgi:preprotein translocase subunit SecE
VARQEPSARPAPPPLPRVGVGGRIGIGRFFGEVISELRKVNWPTRQEATRLTVLVLTVSVAIGIFLGLLDNLFSRLFGYIAR